MPSLLSALALGLTLLSAPAQEAPPAPAEATAAEAAAPAAVQPSAAAQPAPTGLPRRAPEPPTMAEFWWVFAAFALTWVGIVGYFLALGRRSKRIARALHAPDAPR